MIKVVGHNTPVGMNAVVAVFAFPSPVVVAQMA
jgi:hypothetical protein